MLLKGSCFINLMSEPKRWQKLLRLRNDDDDDDDDDIPIGSMGLVYLPIHLVNYYGKCRYNVPVPWILWVCHVIFSLKIPFETKRLNAVLDVIELEKCVGFPQLPWSKLGAKRIVLLVLTLVFQNPRVIPCEDRYLDPLKAEPQEMWKWVQTPILTRYDWKTRVSSQLKSWVS